MNMHKRKGKAFKTPKESRERNQRTRAAKEQRREEVLQEAMNRAKARAAEKQERGV
jgi:hypothetical protein